MVVEIVVEPESVAVLVPLRDAEDDTLVVCVLEPETDIVLEMELVWDDDTVRDTVLVAEELPVEVTDDVSVVDAVDVVVEERVVAVVIIGPRREDLRLAPTRV